MYAFSVNGCVAKVRSYMPVSWSSLVVAMCKAGKYYELAPHMEVHSLPVTMNTLENFFHPSTKSVNIPREVGVEYFDLAFIFYKILLVLVCLRWNMNLRC